jgi:ABC-type glutathione transport system ATPase component
VLRNARLEVFPGEFVGLVGQSGSGETTMALAILRLLDHAGAHVEGRTTFLGKELQHSDERHLRPIRGRPLSMIRRALPRH